MTNIYSQHLITAKRLKYVAYACLAISFGVALSGKLFISGYDISTYKTSVIEANLMQVAQLRYVCAAIIALAGVVLFSASQLVTAIIFGNGGQTTAAVTPAPTIEHEIHA